MGDLLVVDESIIPLELVDGIAFTFGIIMKISAYERDRRDSGEPVRSVRIAGTGGDALYRYPKHSAKASVPLDERTEQYTTPRRAQRLGFLHACSSRFSASPAGFEHRR